MKRVVLFLNGIRALPAILCYRCLCDRETIDRDIERNISKENKKNGNGMLYQFVWLLTYKRVFRNIFYYRVGKKSKTVEKLLNLLMPKQQDCEITGEIGPGLAIWHGYGTVISCHRIGENFSVWQGVTIGRNPKPGLLVDRPTIGDNCSVFTNAVVAGNIEIGSNVKIGAGAVCMKNIPENSVVLAGSCQICEYKRES